MRVFKTTCITVLIPMDETLFDIFSQKGYWSKMKCLYKGKTKDVYTLKNGNILLKFKDDATGTDGVFDPGANTVGLSIKGMGLNCLKLTTHFFQLLHSNNIQTHYVASDYSNNTMEVLPCEAFGNGIEVICRYRATGSFIRRYGQYAMEGQALDGFVEATLKDDQRGDPPIQKDALVVLKILSDYEYDFIETQTKAISSVVKDELNKYGLELYDIKLEFGRHNDSILLIDEISGGNMRVYKDGKLLSPSELTTILL